MEKGKLIKEVVELHRRVNRSMRQSAPDAWMQLTMTVPQVKSMFFISNHGTTNFKNMAAALKVTPSNLTGVVDRLVDQGLVSRTEDREDRRKTVLKTTEKGEALVSELRERRMSFISNAIEDMSLEELSTIVSGLELLAQALESQKGPAVADEESEISNVR
jgi:MarR family transcriptional regulator, organic hydroperoxide resistance regulator